MRSGTIFANVPEELKDEQFLTLFASPKVKIERIVSTRHPSPSGYWFDQEWTEWFIVLSGSAGLHIEGEDAPRERFEPEITSSFRLILSIASNEQTPIGRPFG